MRCVVAVNTYAAAADLQEKLPILGELEDLTVAVAVTGEPDIVLDVNGDAMLATAGTPVAIQAPFGCAGLALGERRMQSSAIKPFVPAALIRAAPSLDVFTVGAELDDWRSR